MSSNLEKIVKTTTTELLNNKLWRLWCPDEHLRSWIEKIKNLREQNFEGEANNKLLDQEDTQRSNSKSKYLGLTLVLNILIQVEIFTLFYVTRDWLKKIVLDGWFKRTIPRGVWLELPFPPSFNGLHDHQILASCVQFFFIA